MNLPDRQKRALIEPHDELAIEEQCQLLGLARSSYYYQPAEESSVNLMLMNRIDQMYTDNPFYGTRRMMHCLRREGHPVNRKRISRLMRLMGLEAVYPKPNLSKSHPEHRIYPYLLRGLDITHTDQVWSTDITYIRLQGGFAYLVAIIDWYSRYVLSWELSNSLDTRFCLMALEKALDESVPEIFNTDQGAQFTSDFFTAKLRDKQVRISMDGRGRALDNIFIERLWRSVKYENVYLKGYETMIEVYRGLEAYFNFYNNERPHQSLGYRTPAEVYYEPLTQKEAC